MGPQVGGLVGPVATWGELDTGPAGLTAAGVTCGAGQAGGA